MTKPERTEFVAEDFMWTPDLGAIASTANAKLKDIKHAWEKDYLSSINCNISEQLKEKWLNENVEPYDKIKSRVIAELKAESIEVFGKDLPITGEWFEYPERYMDGEPTKRALIPKAFIEKIKPKVCVHEPFDYDFEVPQSCQHCHKIIKLPNKWEVEE